MAEPVKRTGDWLVQIKAHDTRTRNSYEELVRETCTCVIPTCSKIFLERVSHIKQSVFYFVQVSRTSFRASVMGLTLNSVNYSSLSRNVKTIFTCSISLKTESTKQLSKYLLAAGGRLEFLSYFVFDITVLQIADKWLLYIQRDPSKHAITKVGRFSVCPEQLLIFRFFIDTQL